jgi:hypothetical protein
MHTQRPLRTAALWIAGLVMVAALDALLQAAE